MRTMFTNYFILNSEKIPMSSMVDLVEFFAFLKRESEYDQEEKIELLRVFRTNLDQMIGQIRREAE